MKLIIAIIKPFKLDEVRVALSESGSRVSRLPKSRVSRFPPKRRSRAT